MCVCVPIFFIIFSSYVKLVFDIPIVSTAYWFSPHYIGYIPIPSLSPSFSRCLRKPGPGAIRLERAQHGRLGPLRSRH